MNKYVVALIIAVLLALTIIFKPAAIALRSVEPSAVLQLISTLFVIALFLERFLDVFLTTWRAAESENMAHEISTLRKQATEKVENSTILNELSVKEKALFAYKKTTRNIALWSGFILSIVIAMVGIRTLFPLIDSASLHQVSVTQQAFFRLADVLITGGLLAGGSDGIHKLAELYRVFLENSKTKVNV